MLSWIFSYMATIILYHRRGRYLESQTAIQESHFSSAHCQRPSASGFCRVWASSAFRKKKAVVRKNVCIEAAALDLKPSPECPACAEKIKPGLAVCRSCGAILDNAKAAQFGLVVPVQESLARKKNQGRELSGNPIGIVDGRQCLTNGCDPAHEAWQKVSPSRFFFWIFNFSTPTRQLGWTRWCAQSLRTKYSAGIDPACHIKIGLYAPRVAKQERTPSETYLSTAQLSRCIFGLTARPISYIMLTTKSIQFAPLWISRGKRATPESGFLFPPSAYCPSDCEFCNLPCKLSRYHVGTHSCGARHYPDRQSPNGLAAALLALVDMGSPSVVRPASKQRVGEESHGAPAFD